MHCLKRPPAHYSSEVSPVIANKKATNCHKPSLGAAEQHRRVTASSAPRERHEPGPLPPRLPRALGRGGRPGAPAQGAAPALGPAGLAPQHGPHTTGRGDTAAAHLHGAGGAGAVPGQRRWARPSRAGPGVRGAAGGGGAPDGAGSAPPPLSAAPNMDGTGGWAALGPHGPGEEIAELFELKSSLKIANPPAVGRDTFQ